MKNKQINFFLMILIFCLCWGIGMFFCWPSHPVHKTIFDLQNEYAKNLEKKLIDLLEPAVGIGNVRTNVQANIIHQNITKSRFNPQTFSKTVTHEKGPHLINQSISILINEADKSKLPVYYRLVKAATNLDLRRGDKLDIEILPFVPIPLWTLGLSPLLLVRIGFVLLLLILGGIFWLIKEWIKTFKKNATSYLLPDAQLWHQVASLSAFQLSSFLKVQRPEITAFILHRLSQEKASEIIELLPASYMNQVILHLNYIEKLNSQDQSILLRETERHLNEILKASQSDEGDSNFDELKNWSDTDIQNLLHYISKKDLIKALQNTSLGLQHIFMRNIPPALWQHLIKKSQQTPCSQKESRMAQEKIMHLASLLTEKNECPL